MLERAQRRGFLGPGPVGDHLEHATAFLAAVDPPVRALDLGSGAGIPGLVLALAWPASTWVLLDAGAQRAAHLEEAVADLNLQSRVTIVRERAEIAGREPALRGAFDLVVARSFGPPAVTAECGSPFLRVDGSLVVSEPPDEVADRWLIAGLTSLGLADRGRRGRVRVLDQAEQLSERFPRRVGIPTKRPLW